MIALVNSPKIGEVSSTHIYIDKSLKISCGLYKFKQNALVDSAAVLVNDAQMVKRLAQQLKYKAHRSPNCA